MNSKKKIEAAFVTLLVCSLLLSSCKNAESSADVISMKKPDPNKTQITLMTKYAVYIDSFEKAAEEAFPEIDIVQVGNFTSNYSDEYEKRMANDELTDIVITWPLDAAAKDCENKLLDLAGLDCTALYNTSMLNSISQDGKLYYLPGPTQIRGIVYNKTMFEENGWKLPTDFESFVSLCKEIESSGMRSLQLSFWNKEVLRYAFMGFGYSESFSSVHSLQSLQDFKEGKKSFANFALPAFASFERLIAEGILKPEDLNIRYPIREQMLFNRKCAMVSDGKTLITAAHKAGNTDEFGIMPFFSPGTDGSWGQTIPAQFIGVNANLAKPENKEKYKLVLQLMDYISTPEGQLALASGDKSWVSSLIDSSPPNAPELEPMINAIRAGHFAIFPSFEQAEDKVYDALAAMLRGEINRDEAIKQIDGNSTSSPSTPQAETIAVATETFSLTETGNLVSDILRKNAETDFALFLDNGKDGSYNAKGISAKIYNGNISENDITMRVLPVLQNGEKGLLHKVTMTGENLQNALEYSINDGGWFYYCSGLKMKYDIYEKPGNRVQSLTDANDNPIEPTKLYTVAILEGSVDDKFIDECENTEKLISDIVINALKESSTITPANDGRLIFLQGK